MVGVSRVVYELRTIFSQTGWVFWTLVSVAGVSLVGFRHTTHTLLRIAFVVSLSTLAAWMFFRHPPGSSPMHSASWLCAALCLSWTVSATIVLGVVPKKERAELYHTGFVPVSQIISLLFGVASAIILTVLLAMRMIDVGVDLIRGYPGQSLRDYGFHAEGLWSLGLLLCATFLAFVMSGDRRLVSCQWWLALFMATWACLLQPIYSIAPTGHYERSPTTLILLAVWTVLYAISVFITGRMETTRRWSKSHTHLGGRVDPSKRLPGYRLSCGILTVAMAILVCYHYLVPIAAQYGGYRTSLFVVTACALLSGFTSFMLTARSWNGYLADASFGLTSFSICGLVMLTLPSRPVSLDEHYPMIFTAMIFGLSIAAGLCTWLATTPRSRLSSLTGTTMSNRLISVAKRFAFFNAVMALLASAVMATWPRLPAISTSDDSFGRVIAGLGANLLLLLVLLWSSRRLLRFTFHILTALAVVSAGGFILVRMIPFSSQVVL